MTKKQIQQLIHASYKNDTLDEKIVAKIAQLLSRKDLKAYVRSLQLAEKSRTISLVLPNSKIYNKGVFEKVFKNKKITVTEDPSLLLGLKVIDNDMVYDYSLKSTLERFAHE